MTFHIQATVGKTRVLSFTKFGIYLGLTLYLCLLGIKLNCIHNYEKYENFFFRFGTRTSRQLHLHTSKFVKKVLNILNVPFGYLRALMITEKLKF